MNKGKFLIQLDESKYSKQLPICKSSVLQVAENLYNQVLNGEVTAVNTAELLKFMEEVIALTKKMTDPNGQNSFVDLVRGEIKTSGEDGKKTTSRYGTVLELAETGVKYTFDKCEDPYWKYYNTEVDKLDKKLKAREKFLKTVTTESFPKGMPVGNVIITETGEMHENVTIYAPIKTSTSSFKQSLLDE